LGILGFTEYFWFNFLPNFAKKFLLIFYWSIDVNAFVLLNKLSSLDSANMDGFKQYFTQKNYFEITIILHFLHFHLVESNTVSSEYVSKYLPLSL